MATATFLTEGLSDLTRLILGAAPSYSPFLRLFTNNHTPVAADVLATFIPCALSGYSDSGVNPASWTGSATSGVATYTYPNVTFTFAPYGGGTTIYGGIVYNSSDNKGIYAWLLDTPYAVPAGGGTLTIAITFQDHQC